MERISRRLREKEVEKKKANSFFHLSLGINLHSKEKLIYLLQSSISFIVISFVFGVSKRCPHLGHLPSSSILSSLGVLTP